MDNDLELNTICNCAVTLTPAVYYSVTKICHCVSHNIQTFDLIRQKKKAECAELNSHCTGGCWARLTFYGGCFQAATDALYVSVRVPYLVDGLCASQLHQAPQIRHSQTKVSFMAALSNRVPRRVVRRVVGHVGPLHSSAGVVAVVSVALSALIKVI